MPACLPRPRPSCSTPTGWCSRRRPAGRPSCTPRWAPRRRSSGCWLELFTAELPALAGERDFTEVATEVLERWGLADRTDAVLAFWTRLELDQEVTALIRELRAGGAACWLATNQHELRRAYMSTSLGYDELLDGQLYSCDLGVAKPDPAYFTRAVAQIGCDPGAALFIDDREPNVLGARSAGLRAEVFHLSSGADALRDILAAHGLL